MHDELREGNVELGVGKGQLLGGGMPDVDAGVALTGGVHKWLRGVDGRHRLGAEPRYELAGQGAGPATYIERSLPSLDAPEVGEQGRKPRRVAPHEAVVGVSGNVEAHRPNLSSRRPALTRGSSAAPPEHEQVLACVNDLTVRPVVRLEEVDPVAVQLLAAVILE